MGLFNTADAVLRKSEFYNMTFHYMLKQTGKKAK